VGKAIRSSPQKKKNKKIRNDAISIVIMYTINVSQARVNSEVTALGFPFVISFVSRVSLRAASINSSVDGTGFPFRCRPAMNETTFWDGLNLLIILLCEGA
jgi:hypothetical protein